MGYLYFHFLDGNAHNPGIIHVMHIKIGQVMVDQNATVNSDIGVNMLQTNPLITPESLLLVSTLDGALYAVSKSSGQVQWMLNEGEGCLPC